MPPITACSSTSTPRGRWLVVVWLPFPTRRFTFPAGSGAAGAEKEPRAKRGMSGRRMGRRCFSPSAPGRGEHCSMAPQERGNSTCPPPSAAVPVAGTWKLWCLQGQQSRIHHRAGAAQRSIAARRGEVVLRRDVSGLGSASQVIRSLNQLVADGKLARIGTGADASAAP